MEKHASEKRPTAICKKPHADDQRQYGKESYHGAQSEEEIKSKGRATEVGRALLVEIGRRIAGQRSSTHLDVMSSFSLFFS
jgi:hypothetical protein